MTSALPVPAQMSAVRITRFGGPEVLEPGTVPVPEPGPEDVLIQVAYCGICRHDLLTRAGAFPAISLPVTPGHQVSGRVARTGPAVSDFSCGDRVMTMIYSGCGSCVACRAGQQPLCVTRRPDFLGEDVNGGYAEYVAVRSGTAVPVPDGVALDRAAIITCTLGTAWHAIVTRARVQAGETVALTGASGGVGLHALQILRLIGARSIAITSRASKMETVRAAGADEVVMAGDLHFARRVKELTDGRGADVVLDIVGAATLTQAVHATRPGGRIVVVGNVEGRAAEIKPAHFILKEISLIGTKSCSRPELETVLSHMSGGRLSAHIGGCLPLAQAAEIHRRMETGESQGRLVLEVAGQPGAWPGKPGAPHNGQARGRER